MVSPVERTDAQVVRDVLAGDRDAYRLLVRRYGDVLYGHALRMAASQDDAADLVQRALVQGFQKLRTCRDTDRVGAWLFRILANLCKDHIRSPRRSDIPLAAMEGLLRGRSDPASARGALPGPPLRPAAPVPQASAGAGYGRAATPRVAAARLP